MGDFEPCGWMFAGLSAEAASTWKLSVPLQASFQTSHYRMSQPYVATHVPDTCCISMKLRQP